MSHFVKRIELSDDEASHEAGVFVGDMDYNQWGPKIARCLVNRGMNPDIFYAASMKVSMQRNKQNHGTIFEDLS